jgi:hypothetical protein
MEQELELSAVIGFQGKLSYHSAAVVWLDQGQVTWRSRNAD